MDIELLPLLGSAILGVALASSCGLRAFLPLLLTGLLARFTDWVDLHDSFDWLTSTEALLALSLAALCELLADKVPGVDTLLNALQTPVRTAAGALIYASVAFELPGWVIALLALIIGGGTALSVHVAKSSTRLASSAASAGAASPVMSLFEDLACALGVVLAVAFAGIALVLALCGGFVFVVSASAVWRRWRRRRTG